MILALSSHWNHLLKRAIGRPPRPAGTATSAGPQWPWRRDGLALDRVCHRGGRPANQDACFTALLPGGRAVIVVADGVSGVRFGAQAADLAVSRVGEWLVKQAGHWTEDSIRRSVLEVNRELLRPERGRQWQTTLVGLAIDVERQSGFCFHSGDSQAAYLDGEGSYRRLTESHSRAASLMERGIAGRLGARILGGAATRGLGAEQQPPIQVQPIEVRPGWRFLVATDGLEVLQEREIPSILGRARPGSAALELFRAARDRELTDNVTVVTLGVPPHATVRRPPAGKRRHLDWAALLVGAALLAAVLARDAGLSRPVPTLPVVEPAPSEPAIEVEMPPSPRGMPDRQPWAVEPDQPDDHLGEEDTEVYE